MAQVIPLPLPDWLVNTYGLDLEAPPSDGLSLSHHDVAFSPSGEMYALSHLWRAKPHSADAVRPAE